MKRVLFSLICSFVFWGISAQNHQGKIVLKNGTELVGKIISIDSSKNVVISIAGVESEIKMSDVAKIEDVNNDSPFNNNVGVSSEFAKMCELAEGSGLERAFSEHLTLVYGTLDCFLNEKNSFRVNLEFPALRIEGGSFEQYIKGRESGWRDEFNQETEAALNAFISKWNQKVKGIRAKKNNADMTMNLFITELDLGSTAAAIWGMRTIDGGASMSGFLELVDNNSDVVLSIVRIDDIKGLGNNGFAIYKEGNRLKKVFEKLAIKMAEDIK
ncbi:MAG: hypothetical protein IKX36_10545 [Prevotella sp.]|nr:hypothetical protein [Prevotella sp.]